MTLTNAAHFAESCPTGVIAQAAGFNSQIYSLDTTPEGKAEATFCLRLHCPQVEVQFVKLGKVYQCPVCGKPLTKAEFERALEIHKARERHVKDWELALRRREKRLKQEKRAAARDAQAKEKRRAERLMAGQRSKIKKLEERIAQLECGKTPQTEGLEFEEKLAARLRREFPEDDIQHKGKDGDVLHLVHFGGKHAGTIIYECKRTPSISVNHARQAYLAKQTRHAEFAVLVTTGARKGFAGLMELGGVLVVSPLGAIPLAALLRQNLVEMMRANITRKKRAKIAQQLLKYITSPQLKNPIEEVIQTATELQNMVKEEYDQHVRTWKKRLGHYQKIHWDTSQVQENIQRILHGKEPKAILPPKAPPLLPASTA